MEDDAANHQFFSYEEVAVANLFGAKNDEHFSASDVHDVEEGHLHGNKFAIETFDISDESVDIPSLLPTYDNIDDNEPQIEGDNDDSDNYNIHESETNEMPLIDPYDVEDDIEMYNNEAGTNNIALIDPHTNDNPDVEISNDYDFFKDNMFNIRDHHDEDQLQETPLTRTKKSKKSTKELQVPTAQTSSKQNAPSLLYDGAESSQATSDLGIEMQFDYSEDVLLQVIQIILQKDDNTIHKIWTSVVFAFQFIIHYFSFWKFQKISIST